MAADGRGWDLAGGYLVVRERLVDGFVFLLGGWGGGGGCGEGGEELDDVVGFVVGEVAEDGGVEALAFEMSAEGDGGEEFGGLVIVHVGFGLGGGGRRGGSGVGGGVGGDAGDLEDGGAGASCDFGFVGDGHEGDEFGEGVGDVFDGEEAELEDGDVGFEGEELGGVGVVEGFLEVFGGAVEVLEEGVEVGDGFFEVGEEGVGLEVEFGVLLGEMEVGMHDGLLLVRVCWLSG